MKTSSLPRHSVVKRQMKDEYRCNLDYDREGNIPFFRTPHLSNLCPGSSFQHSQSAPSVIAGHSLSLSNIILQRKRSLGLQKPET